MLKLPLQINNKKLMKTSLLATILFFITLTISAQSNWDNIVVTETTEVFIDSTTIKHISGQVYASIKTIYTTQDARRDYIGNIKKVFKKDADKKIKKWDDFSYTITRGVYDCGNSRFKILEVEDYDSNGKNIIKTKKKEDKALWINVDKETVGDYTLFYICDYE